MIDWGEFRERVKKRGEAILKQLDDDFFDITDMEDYAATASAFGVLHEQMLKRLKETYVDKKESEDTDGTDWN